MKKMRLCSVCTNYTMEKIHCGRIAISAHPAPFKSNDPYGFYRRKSKGISS
ncbi:ribosome biogenesis protein [Candidatus Micrarchaeota archaeon]|nr:ribosome biogenesis protein [Candidatus Micrarchaeota archaeon]